MRPAIVTVKNAAADAKPTPAAHDQRLTAAAGHGSALSGIEEITEGVGILPDAVTVVVPAYNEADHVASQIEAVRTALDATGWRYEIIVVDDGSTDGTAARAAATGVRVLRRKTNRGYGAALKAGIAQASYDWILITDADGTYPPSEIPRLLACSAGNDMVVGARTGKVVHVPWTRRPAKAFLNALASYLAGQKLPDINSGLRLMRADLVRRYAHLLPSGFSFTTTITLSAACNDHVVEHVPIDYHVRKGQSKIRPRHAYDFLLLIIRTVVFFNPLKVFVPVGAALALAGLVMLAQDVARRNLTDSTVLALLSALLIWAVGLLADQNARIAAGR